MSRAPRVCICALISIHANLEPISLPHYLRLLSILVFLPARRLRVYDHPELAESQYGNWTSNRHLVQNDPYTSPLSRTLINLVNHHQRLLLQISQYDSTILETSGTLHVSDGILLNFIIGRFLLQYIDQLPVLRVGTYAVDDWEREFPFCKILAETFVLGVLSAGEVHVVVSDLEEKTYRIHQRYEVPARLVSHRMLND